MFLAVFVFILVVVYYFMEYHRKMKYYKDKIKCFDGPRTLPLIGNLHYFMTSSKELVKRLPHWIKVYNGSFRVWLLNELLIVITKPEDIQILASMNLEKDSNYRFLSDLMGDGLITCSVAKWKRRRRIVDRAFNTTVWSKYFLNVFNNRNMQLIQKLNQEVKRGKLFDVWPYIISTSFSSICETAMGYKEERNEGDIIESKDIYFEASKLACKRCYQPWLQPAILFQIYTYLKGYPDIFKKAQDLPRKLIKTKKKLLSEQKRINTDEQIESKTSKNLLEILLEVQEGNDNFTEKELTDEMLTIIVAGTETNALVDSFTLLMLAMHPQIQEKVYEELYEIFGETDRQPTLEDLHQMKFLEQCLKETLRLFSTVPLIHRETNKDIPITDGKVIPSGARIVICSYAVHHDEKYYPDPEKWNPHNFDQDKSATRHPYAFIPFGAGPRTCLGNKYAMLSMKAQLSTVLRHFKITTDMQMEDIELSFDFVIRNDPGYRIKLEYRVS